jgi:serine protease Do
LAELIVFHRNLKQFFSMKIHRPKIIATGAALIAGALLMVGSSIALSPNADSQRTSLNLKVDTTPVNRNDKQPMSYSPIVQKVAPSVVKIFVTTKPDNRLSRSDLDFFRRFFGEPDGGMPNSPFGGGQAQHALGSGVILSSDGYILSNNHVVNNAGQIRVALNDGRQFPAKVVGTDEKTDVALLKIGADNLPAVALADSDKVEVGDVVLAIGNPFGIGQTVTKGIVSAKNRTAFGQMDEDFIQTDAAINPGNSGGALVDTQGRLVGMNTAIYSRTGGNMGIGFAVPSNLARWVVDSLVTKGRVDRGYLGVSIQDVTPELAQAFKVKNSAGALVGDVSPSSPAEKAGLKSGDVIVRFDGKPVENASQLKLHVAETAPGSSVPVEINRDGQTQTLNVSLGNFPKERVARSNSNSDQSDNHEALAGVGVQDLDQKTSEELGIPSNVRGAVVSDVAQDSAAYEAGLRPGDVIVEINHEPVRNAEDAVAKTKQIQGNETLLKVWTKGGAGGQGGTRYLTVNEGSR